jgi:Mor family transcriptional regulator
MNLGILKGIFRSNGDHKREERNEEKLWSKLRGEAYPSLKKKSRDIYFFIHIFCVVAFFFFLMALISP